MQVTELVSQGLKRELKIVVPAGDLSTRLEQRLVEMKDKVRINGFRPGKVPVGHLKRLVGRSEMANIINDVITETIKSVVDERKERPALNPDIDIAQDSIEPVVEGKADLTFTASYELLPEIETKDLSEIAVERLVVETPTEEIDEQVKRLADNARPFEDKGEGAIIASGDKANIDFVGKIDDVAFEGGSAEGVDLVIGSGQFIPGFEEQLVGAKAGDAVTVKVAFPADYQAEHLAGKDAVFDVKVNAVSAPGEMAIDDEFAKKLGLESLEKLREVVAGQINAQFTAAARQKVKRQLLDKLDGVYQLAVPEKLVQGEFDQIWRQVTTELAQNNKSFADENTTEEAARADYLKIAERRVRLGLVLSEIGEKNAIQVTDEEVQRALIERVRQFPGQERQVFDFYRNNQAALASLRAPIYEEKVVDYLLTQVKVTEKTVSREELMKDDEEAAA